MKKLMLTKKTLAIGVMGTMVLLSACSSKNNNVSDTVGAGKEQSTKQTEKSSSTSSAYEDDFIWVEWKDGVISGFSETGLNKKDIVIPKSCKEIERELHSENMVTLSFENDDFEIGTVFDGNKNLKEVNFPKNMTEVPMYAFWQCESLESINLPEKVTKIDASAFADCSSLKSVKMADNVNEMAIEAFRNCTSLTDIELSKSLETIGMLTFDGCTSLTEITLPENIVTIEDGAFQGCTSLTNVTLPNNLKEIGENAFYDCDSLAEISLPDSIEYIGAEAFSLCKSLTEITLPASLKSVGAWAFLGEGITKIYVPEELELDSYSDVAFGNGYPIDVYVVEGSWADEHFDEVFGTDPDMTKVYY